MSKSIREKLPCIFMVIQLRSMISNAHRCTAPRRENNHLHAMTFYLCCTTDKDDERGGAETWNRAISRCSNVYLRASLECRKDFLILFTVTFIVLCLSNAIVSCSHAKPRSWCARSSSMTRRSVVLELSSSFSFYFVACSLIGFFPRERVLSLILFIDQCMEKRFACFTHRFHWLIVFSLSHCVYRWLEWRHAVFSSRVLLNSNIAGSQWMRMVSCHFTTGNVIGLKERKGEVSNVSLLDKSVSVDVHFNAELVIRFAMCRVHVDASLQCIVFYWLLELILHRDWFLRSCSILLRKGFSFSFCSEVSAKAERGQWHVRRVMFNRRKRRKRRPLSIQNQAEKQWEIINSSSSSIAVPSGPTRRHSKYRRRMRNFIRESEWVSEHALHVLSLI